ncbi:hypothetical protein OO013_20050 [Mangrovivirga sp. M17]|uniref:VCBS repeat-containing protein n=1 Tax=Mangrovivirga halotolerans TaxID=2993936 RepID=A0ABT3RY97_9BACT|nr:hypothetical protein [Mangrovivirga halotolerans]MCX2746182.1 hypothetical protein [Mangrovivirga halotolerans]
MKQLISTILLIISFVSNGQEILWDSTFIVDKQKFNVTSFWTKSGSYAKIIKTGIDTITVNDVTGNIEILNFNNDGFADIILSYLGNNYTADLYLYDKKSKSYRKVEGFMDVSEAKRLDTNPNYYYSYRRGGCADMNWLSYLFFIDNSRVYQIGEIYGIGCDSEESDRLIKVSKISSNDDINTIENISIDRIDDYPNYKWGFIKDYWNRNYMKFKYDNAP